MINWTFVEEKDVGSTQAIAKGLAAMGAPEGTIVVAKSQSSGQGRLGRSWDSPSGGLYMSFILRPVELFKPELMTLVSAVAVVEGVRQSTGLDPSVRWPNDVILNGKKLAGIIAEAQISKGEVTQVVVGIGVNCNTLISDPELTTKATSISEALGRRIEISELKHAILKSFSALYERWKAGEDLSPLWNARLSTIGRQVVIKLKTSETPFSCVAQETDSDGGLLVETEGETVLVRPEDLEWLREEV